MIMRTLFIKLIHFYQMAIRPLLPHCCRFYPSCSEYSKESIFVHGVVKGIVLSVMRILKCHPFHKGGYDFVPVAQIHKRRFQWKNV